MKQNWGYQLWDSPQFLSDENLIENFAHLESMASIKSHKAAIEIEGFPSRIDGEAVHWFSVLLNIFFENTILLYTNAIIATVIFRAVFFFFLFFFQIDLCMFMISAYSRDPSNVPYPRIDEHTLVPSKVYFVSDDSWTDMDYFLGVIDCIFRKLKDNESR